MESSNPELLVVIGKRAGGRKKCVDVPIKPLRKGLKATAPPETMNVGAFAMQTVLHYVTIVFFPPRPVVTYPPAGGRKKKEQDTHAHKIRMSINMDRKVNAW